MKTCLAEAVGSFAFTFVCVGVIQNHPPGGDLVLIALAQGGILAAMVSATAKVSGGHINPAVTLGAFLGGKIRAVQAVLYIAAQLVGAVVAGIAISLLFGKGAVILGTPTLTKIGFFPGIILEGILTFFLVLTAFGAVLDSEESTQGWAVGLAWAAGIMLAEPWTGGGFSPAAAFGPALASGALIENGAPFLQEHLVYWIGPLLGGGLAGALYGRYLSKPKSSLAS